MSEATGNTSEGGVFETRADAGKGQQGVVRYWLQALEIADREEKEWREDAEDAESIYRGGAQSDPENRRRFNILYSNTETLASALYNSAPVPDVRRRFADDDQAGRIAAQVLERALSYSIDEYDIDQSFKKVVLDGLVPGRGIIRVKYVPTVVDNQLVSQQVTCEAVDWRAFRRGPGRRWEDIPWIAFRHYLSRDEIRKINPAIGNGIKLEAAIPSAEKDGSSDNLPDVFKRGEVWEIWDKETRKVVFIAPSHTAAPLAEYDDPLGLAGFFPIPRPFQPVEIGGSLVPVEPYKLYKGLAEELEDLTGRARRLIKALRWRGAYLDPQIGDFLSKFEDLEDGEVAPIDNPAMASNGGLERAFWFQPTEQAAAVLQRVYEAREQTKQSIYEVTGIADLLRGASRASETATAQNIKAQWGSLRIQAMQAEIQRIARDVMRLKAEIIAEKFEPQLLGAMTGIQIDPQVLELLKADPLRRYRVDVETDSTIRADLQRQQENITGFVSGFGGFVQAIGPAVQAGVLPMPVVAEMVKSFSRVFKLGRAVEEALDSLPTQAPQQEDPNAAAAAQQQAEQQAQQAEMARMQAQMQLKQMEIEATNQREAAKLELEREKMMMDHDLRIAAHNHSVEHAERTREHEGRRFGLEQRIAESQAIASGIGMRGEDEPSVMDVLRKVAAGQEDLAARTDNQAGEIARVSDAVAGVVQAMSAPKRIVRDAKNRAVGVEVEGVGMTHRIIRGADGRPIGTEPVAVN